MRVPQHASSSQAAYRKRTFHVLIKPDISCLNKNSPIHEWTEQAPRTTKPPAMSDPASRRFVLSGLLLCFFFSGAAGLIYQVAWSKALGLIFGHTAYAVATVLAVFMGGLAAGSAWLGQWGERTDRPIALYGWIELGVAAGGSGSSKWLLNRRVFPWASRC